jgi:hypothetical protein
MHVAVRQYFSGDTEQTVLLRLGSVVGTDRTAMRLNKPLELRWMDMDILVFFGDLFP